MVEAIMFVGLGFFAASLLALIVVPLVHARAVRLTTRRLEAAAPVSIAEIQADKDQLRAEFAISTRRLEMSVDQLKTRTTGQLAELGKKTEAINSLKAEVTEKAAAIFALESREKALQDRLQGTEQELSGKAEALRDTERKLAEKEAELARVGANLEDRSLAVDSQRIDIVALKTQIASLKDQVSDLEVQVKTTEDRLSRERSEAQKAAKELADERGKVENLSPRVAQLERQLAAATAETEMLGGRVRELDAQLGEQGRALKEADRQREQLRLDIEAARQIEADLRSELVDFQRQHEAATQTLLTEKTRAETQLERTREERARLQRELATLKHETEEVWANERVENALMRERINDVAAEVTRLTTALEGPGSPIETILAADAIGTPINGNGAQNGNGEIAMPAGKGSLADRIRALQGRASRMS
jgi:chromosome segregation ATPase